MLAPRNFWDPPRDLEHDPGPVDGIDLKTWWQLTGECHITKHFRYLKWFGILTQSCMESAGLCKGSFPTPQNCRKLQVQEVSLHLRYLLEDLVIICDHIYVLKCLQASPLTVPMTSRNSYRNCGEMSERCLIGIFSGGSYRHTELQQGGPGKVAWERYIGK